jgi:hypothetical protein
MLFSRVASFLLPGFGSFARETHVSSAKFETMIPTVSFG